MTDDAALATEIITSINERRLDDVIARLHPDYRVEWPEGVLDLDHAVVREIEMFTAFPDTHFGIERITALADGRVLVESTITATHTGPLHLPGGIEVTETGRPLRLPFTFLMRFDGGLLLDERLFFDQLTMLVQIGAMP